MKTKPDFPLTGKCFPLTNFSNGKQTQESLEIGFPEIIFRKTNTAKRENTFLETKPNFSSTGKCFPLTNFSNGKQTQENLKNGLPKTTFQKTNMALMVKKFPWLTFKYLNQVVCYEYLWVRVLCYIYTCI